MEDLQGCADLGCVVSSPKKGQVGTNGGCRCNTLKLKQKIHYSNIRIKELEKYSKEALELADLRRLQIEKLEEKLQRVREFGVMDIIMLIGRNDWAKTCHKGAVYEMQAQAIVKALYERIDGNKTKELNDDY